MAPVTPLRTPLVIALIGLPGAGKSELARALEHRLGMHRICRDSIRQALFPRCEYSPAERRAANHASMTALEVNCAMGRDSVLDGRTFARQSERESLAQRVIGYGANTLAVWLDCPVELARERVAAQAGHSAGDRDPQLVEQVALRFETPTGCLHVDARQPLQAMLDDSVAVIAELRASLAPRQRVTPQV